ncbi:S-adenosyl-L-methionine-dependent methyltransferase [Trametes elegans]|nr:S-adenosyl-L-methionine-dependent methyltransferase [Trametes elegans]
MSTFATLRALHALIGDALGEIEGVYRTRPEGTSPLDYPSLDVPHYNTAAHGAAQEAAEKLTSDPTVVTAMDKIVAACGQLAASLHRPFFQLVDVTTAGHVTSCMQFLEASHTVEILRAAGAGGMHVRKIARTIDELRGVQDGSVHALDSSKLGHILRVLATHHWLKEVRPDVFANNRLSAQIDTGKSLDQLRAGPEKKYDDTDGVAALVAMHGDEFHKSIAHLTDQLLPTLERSVSLRRPLDRDRIVPLPPTYKTPFSLTFRTNLGYFEWLKLPENKARLVRFGRAMYGARGWEVAENFIHAYPWKGLPQDAVIIDVGGGIGSTSIVLAEAYPHLRFVVQNREHVVDIAPTVSITVAVQKAWDAAHAKSIESGKVSFKAQDFFQPQPRSIRVSGAGTISSPAVYLVRGCTHKWPDVDVVKMLRHLRNSVGSGTELLIVDMLLPLACVDDGEEEEPIPGAVRSLAPVGSPLLANLGKASAHGYMLDISMMGMLNSKERTLRELSALARAAGWKVTGTTRATGSLWAYTSATPI